jgi:hypothetical protein
MSFIIGKLTKLNKRVLVSATSDIEIPKYTRVVNPTILDLFQKMNKKPIPTKLVVSKERDKIGSLFSLICSLKSQSAIFL